MYDAVVKLHVYIHVCAVHVCALSSLSSSSFLPLFISFSPSLYHHSPSLLSLPPLPILLPSPLTPSLSPFLPFLFILLPFTPSSHSPLLPSFLLQLREVGRKFRTLHEEAKKELEGVKAENTELKKKLEEASVPSKATPAVSASEIASKTKVLSTPV